MRCANCDAAIPDGGSFCIECGAPVAQAATGATERLPEHAGGPTCAACGTRNPPGAAFCVHCGRAFGPRPMAEAPGNPIRPTPLPAPIAPAPSALPMPHTPPVPAMPRGGLNSATWGGISGGIFLIGLAVLFMTGWWWPGILVLIGITSLVGSLASHQSLWAGLQGAIWLFGIAILAITGWWWPGILVLVGVSAILGSVLRPKF